MAGIGKLFKFGGKKPPEPPRKDYDGRDQDSDEEGYIDPSTYHSSISASSGSLSSKMPNYPPPRPNHPNIAPKPVDISSRSQHRHPIDGSYKPPVKPRPARTQRGNDTNQTKAPVDDYCEPWDTKQRKPKMTADDYCDPVDVTKPTTQVKDDYSDPWDSRPGNNIAKPKVKKSGVKDEYIDPWDAKGPQNPNQPKPSDSDDDGYTEPYDTGKITALDEQAKRLSLRGMRLPSAGHADHEQHAKPQTQLEDNRPTDDYESPWESKGLILPSQTSGLKQPQPKPGQMPVSDTRPCDDYDKPWEWAVKQQAHQYNGPFSQSKSTKNQPSKQAPVVDSRPETDYDAPWEYNKRTSQLVQSMAQEQAKSDVSSMPQKPPRVVSPDHESTFAMDLSLPLEKQSWYHGPITRVEAECLLKYEENGSFLVRDSESSSRDYSLSFKNNNAFMHLKIAANSQGKYVLGQFSLPYDSVPEIIDHYARNKLNIRGAVHSYLKTPIAPRHDYFVLEKS